MPGILRHCAMLPRMQALFPATMFFCDPFGNPIEVKGFRSLAGLYAS